MSNGDDKKLHEFKCELASLIGRHVVGLDESSISDVLEEYSETLQGKLKRQRSTSTGNSEPAQNQSPPRKLQEDSSVLLQPDSDVSEAGTTEAEVVRANPPGAAMLKTVGTQQAPEDDPSTPPAPSVFDGLRPLGAQPHKRWKLSESSVADVLREVSRFHGIGLLEMRAGKRKAELLFQEGEIHDIRILPLSNKRSLVAMLQDSGQLDSRQAKRIREYAHEHEITEAEALLQASSAITRSEVAAGIRSRIRHFTHRLIDVQLDTAAYFDLDELPAPLPIASVPVLSVLFANVRAKHTGSNSGPRKQAEERFVGMLLSRKPNPAINVNRLNLQIHERPLLDQVLVKPHDCETILRQSPLQREDTIAILAGLEAVGLLDIVPAGLGEARSSSWAEDLESAVERIRSMEMRLEREDCFEVFELHWATHDAEIEQRYREIYGRFKELSQPMGLEPEDRQRLRKIRTRLKEMYNILSDVRERRRYRREFISPTVQRKTAMSLEALGDEALHQKSYKAALDYYQRLLELDPKNSKTSRLLPTLLVHTSKR